MFSPKFFGEKGGSGTLFRFIENLGLIPNTQRKINLGGHAPKPGHPKKARWKVTMEISY